MGAVATTEGHTTVPLAQCPRRQNVTSLTSLALFAKPTKPAHPRNDDDVNVCPPRAQGRSERGRKEECGVAGARRAGEAHARLSGVGAGGGGQRCRATRLAWAHTNPHAPSRSRQQLQ